MASKSKKRRRVLGASCILAALIIAGSSFAWFTSKDEVTNRLSASSDYGVRIVESFAPPENWIPGQEVNKDTYSVNTGNIASYVRNDVSGVLTITTEKPVKISWDTGDNAGKAKALLVDHDNNPATDDQEQTFSTGSDFASFVTLEEDEVFSIEAGSYLAYKPKASQQELGKQVVIYPSNADITGATKYRCNKAGTYNSVAYTLGQIINKATYTALSEEEKANFDAVAAKTDFTPDAEGLYVFRRTVVVNNNATEQFTYDGYYFKDGTYYKITDLKVTQDDSVAPTNNKELDVAGDGNDMDGQLANAEAKFLVDKTEVLYEPETFVYDEDNNRLVATYLNTSNTAFTNYENAAKLLDQKEHNLARTRTALDRALNDEAASDAQVAFYMNRIAQLQNELDAVNARIKQLVGETGDATTPDGGTIIDNLKDEEKRLYNTGTPNGVIQTATEAANTSLVALYGKKSGDVQIATANLDPANADFGKVSYNGGAAGDPLPTTVSGLAAESGTNSLYRQYLTAKEAVENARQPGAYGHDLFTAYVNELIKIYGPAATSPANRLIPADATYEDVLNKLSYTQLMDVATELGTVDPELHDLNELTANLVKAKKDYEDELANYKSQRDKIKTNTARLGVAGTTTPATDTDNTTDIVGGTDIKYTTYSVEDQSGVRGDLAVATAEYNTLLDKKNALDTAIATATQKAIEAENVGGQAGGTDASATVAAAWTAYQTASKEYDDALNDYRAKQKAYEDGNPLKIYINLSDSVVTESAGLPDRWFIWDKDNLENQFTDHGTDAVTTKNKDNSANSKADTAVFYYTGILMPGETSAKLIDSVELDSGVTQGMYKNFDYDLNVALKSAQITYKGADNGTISTVPADTELGNDAFITPKAKASLTNDKSTDTAVNWTPNP